MRWLEHKFWCDSVFRNTFHMEGVERVDASYPNFEGRLLWDFVDSLVDGLNQVNSA